MCRARDVSSRLSRNGPSGWARSASATAAELVDALRNAKPGAKLALAPGYYTGVVISGRRFSVPVTLTSVNPSSPGGVH